MLRSYKIHVCVCLVVLQALFMGEGFCRKREYGPLDHHIDIGYTSWFTGPLFSPTPINMPPAHPAIEPSIIIGANYGAYDEHWHFVSSDNMWFINPSIDFQFGITDRIGMEIFAPFITNFKKGVSSTYFQDIPVLLGFQIATDVRGEWTPDIRLDIQEIFPAGNYQRLSPEKLGTDATGFGSFQTGPVFIIHKEFYPGKNPLALKASVAYTFPSNVTVHGLNVYGGGDNTQGTVHPGQILTIFLSLEHALTQRLGWGFDAMYVRERKSTFSGNPGIDAYGQEASVGLPSSSQYSFAPFLEYTFSAQLGLLGGAWVTLGGRNADAFASSYFGIVYIF